MNYEEFKDKVVEDVRRELETRTGKPYYVQAHTVEKTNENYDAITVKPEDGIIGVNLNVEELYKAYKDRHSYDSIVDRAVSMADSSLNNHPDFDLNAIKDYDSSGSITET